MLHIYDNTYEGLLCALFDVLSQKDKNAEIIPQSRVDGPSLYYTRYVTMDREHADRIGAMLERFRPGTSARYYTAWLSHDEHVEEYALAATRYAIKHKCDPFALRQYHAVHELDRLARLVGGEAHRMLQFVRFKKLRERVYAADIRPEYEVLPLIGSHFHMRFRDVAFIIRDLNHRRAILSNTREWYIAELPEHNPPLDADGEYEDLWRTYFDNIAIPHRRNPKLQQQFVPLKYRSTMTEFMHPSE